MVCERMIVQNDPENGIYPLCACGCRRPIFRGDDVFITDMGLFLISVENRPKWDSKYYTEERVSEIIKDLSEG